MASERIDLLIIGAGPAGMSAAVEARRHGLEVLVLDEQPSPGGQIYRNIRESDPQRLSILGDDYSAGRRLADEFIASGARYVPGAAVWQVGEQCQVHYLLEGRSLVVQARRLLIATGAFERPMPIPGWTLPGVMSAGAGQILLKSADTVPAAPAVLLVVARWAGLSWDDLGLARRTWRVGLAWAGVIIVVVTSAYAAVALFPPTRGLF